MTPIQQRIEVLDQWANAIEANRESLNQVFQKARNINPWFTIENINLALDAILTNYLDKQALAEWSKNLSVETNIKNVGIIMAGNIPLVGFHDLLSCLISGHKAIIKLSEKDATILPALTDLLLTVDTSGIMNFEYTDRLLNIDAIIATGSNQANQYFKKYFAHIPHIIRGHRNGVAVLNNKVTEEEIKDLGKDIFRYFGLGCRNVSKLYLQKGFNLHKIFEGLISYGDIINHHKYKNNYDYSNALYLMNSEDFLTNNFLILRQSENINSRISCLHYEFYENEEALIQKLEQDKSNIQCIISNEEIKGIETFRCGNAQTPKLNNYADNIDSLQFLNKLNDEG